MKLPSLLRSAPVLLMTMIVASCSTTERLKTSSATVGKINAGVNLPSLPSDCRAIEPHFALTTGMEARTAIVGERGALTRANARVTRCGSFYDAVKTSFASPSK